MRIQLKPLGRRGHDDGAVAVIVALLSVVLLLMAAFAVDLGNAYAVKRQLSVAADAAALDAARAVAVAKSGGLPILGAGRGCASWTPAQKSAAQVAAESAAEATNSANDLSTESAVDAVEITCVGDSRVGVRVDNSRDLPVFFGGVADISGIEPKRSATAAVRPQLSIGNLRPYAACNTVVISAQASPGQTFVMDLDNKIGICNGTASGNWGLTDFDPPSGTPDLVDWTYDGYPDPVPAPDPNLDVRPGIPNTLDAPLQTLIDQVVLFPVVTGVTGTGTGARFNLVGFVSAKVCGYWISSTRNGQGSCYDPAKALPYINARPNAVRFLQFRYVDYTGGYSGGGPTCNFTNPNCRYAPLSAQLWE